MSEEKKHYETVLKNGSISLPNVVIKKLGLKEGDTVVIRIAKVGKWSYAYISGVAAEVFRTLS